MVALGRTIPALPVRSIGPAVDFYRKRLGFGSTHQDKGFAIIRRDAAEIHLWQAGDEEWRARPTAERPIRSGAESFLAGTASCRVGVEGIDALFAELAASETLHPTSLGGVTTTDYGTREISALDLDGNLLGFFEPLPDGGSAP